MFNVFYLDKFLNIKTSTNQGGSVLLYRFNFSTLNIHYQGGTVLLYLGSNGVIIGVYTRFRCFLCALVLSEEYEEYGSTEQY